MTLAEVADRSARIYPTPPHAGACTCGEKFATLEELDERFWAVFIPAPTRA